jgi:hypothetical protein
LGKIAKIFVCVVGYLRCAVAIKLTSLSSRVVYYRVRGIIRLGTLKFELFSTSPNDIRIIGISLVLVLHGLVFESLLFRSHVPNPRVFLFSETSATTRLIISNVKLVVQKKDADVSPSVSKSSVAEMNSHLAQSPKKRMQSVPKPDIGGETDMPQSLAIDEGDRYYVLTELDEASEPDTDIVLERFPNVPITTVVAVVAIYVDSQGNVTDVQVQSITPEEYRNALIDAFRMTKFIPGIRGGSAVNSIKVMEIRVDL